MSHKKKKHSVSICRFLLLSLILVFPIEQALAIIYGNDDRLDYYECTDQSLKDLANDSVVALMDSSDINCSNGDCNLNNSQSLADWYLSEDPIGSGNPLCSYERFLDQPTTGFCSGVMIDDDLILTAGHCIENLPDCQNTAFVFGYKMLGANTPITTFPESDVYYGLEIVAHSEDEAGNWTNDWAIIRVDRTIDSSHTATPVRRTGAVEEDDPLVTIGHPTGLPSKIEPGGSVVDAREGSMDYFLANSDTFGGNSGSGVWSSNESRFMLEGILVRGTHDFVTDSNNSCDKAIRCPDSGCPELEKVIRSTQFADYIPYDYIVVFTDPLSKDNAVASATFPILHDYTIIPGFAAHLDYQQKQQLLTDPNVVYIEPDLPVYISELSTQSVPGGGAGEVIPDGVNMVNAPAVWPTTTGEGAVVCVLDTGLDLDHPDRPESIAPGWDFINDDPDIVDGEGHGTHVAGTVAAAHNAIGVYGIAPNAEIMPLRFLGNSGTGCVSDEIAGIDYAVTNGVDVINMSLGTAEYLQSMEEAVDNAAASGILLVASAGDANDDAPQYPAGHDNVLSVGALTLWKDRADFSNWGPTIDVVAPGVDVLSTANGAYEYRSGTDMAAAHVSGVAALLFAWGGSSMTAPQVRKAIEQTAEDLGSPGRDDYYGYGLVNAENALAYLSAQGIPANCTQVYDFGYGLLPDLNNDCYVSLLDLKLFAVEWLNSCDDGNQWCNKANFDGSGMVSLPNFATFAEQWLYCNDQEEIDCAPCTPNWPTP